MENSAKDNSRRKQSICCTESRQELGEFLRSSLISELFLCGDRMSCSEVSSLQPNQSLDIERWNKACHSPSSSPQTAAWIHQRLWILRWSWLIWNRNEKKSWWNHRWYTFSRPVDTTIDSFLVSAVTTNSIQLILAFADNSNIRVESGRYMVFKLKTSSQVSLSKT